VVASNAGSMEIFASLQNVELCVPTPNTLIAHM